LIPYEFIYSFINSNSYGCSIGAGKTSGGVGLSAGLVDFGILIEDGGLGLGDALGRGGFAALLGLAGLSADGLLDVNASRDLEALLSEAGPLLLILSDGLGVSVLNGHFLLLPVGNGLSVNTMRSLGIAVLAREESSVVGTITSEIGGFNHLISEIAALVSNSGAVVDLSKFGVNGTVQGVGRDSFIELSIDCSRQSCKEGILVGGAEAESLSNDEFLELAHGGVDGVVQSSEVINDFLEDIIEVGLSAAGSSTRSASAGRSRSARSARSVAANCTVILLYLFNTSISDNLIVLFDLGEGSELGGLGGGGGSEKKSNGEGEFH
jgi:hypothetical protein